MWIVTELLISVPGLGEPLAGWVLQVGRGSDPFGLCFQGSRPALSKALD